MKSVVMGCLLSFLTFGYLSKRDEARAISQQIDREIIMELKNEPDEIETLILGASESGKSTFLKQMRLIHQNDFTFEERFMYKPVVYANTIQSMSIILHAVEKLKIKLEHEGTSYCAYRFFRTLEDKTSLSHALVEDIKVTPDLADLMAQMWKDQGIQETVLRSDEFYLPDCASYFLDNVERISDPNYVPTTLDILHTKMKSTEIMEARFFVKGMLFKIHDVGDQQSNRKKWLSLFDCVHAVIFCVALPLYDSMTFIDGLSSAGQHSEADREKESDTRNHMRETLSLFSAMANNKVFLEASMILFFTKVDKFKEKIKRKPITVAFPEYTGNQDFENSINFITKTFKEERKAGPSVICHVMCTIDTNNMRFVISQMTDILIKNFLKDCGIY